MSSCHYHFYQQPAKGLLVYDSVKNQLMVNMGTACAAGLENHRLQKRMEFNG